MEVPNRCWVAIVSEPYLQDLHTVFGTMDSIVQKWYKVPYAVFLLGSDDIDVNSFRYEMSPNIVSIAIISWVSDLIYSWSFSHIQVYLYKNLQAKDPR